MEQTQSRISDERLAEFVAWREWDDPDGLQHDATLIARELTALRASHNRLVEALERAQTLLSATAQFIYANPIGEYTVHYDEAECDGLCLADDCRTAESSADAALADAALAEDGKLEGQ